MDNALSGKIFDETEKQLTKTKNIDIDGMCELHKTLLAKKPFLCDKIEDCLLGLFTLRSRFHALKVCASSIPDVGLRSKDFVW